VANTPEPARDYSRRHLQIGWWMLFVSATAGLALETFHGFKLRFYLDVSNETRRLMWTLAHAHGTLLGAINVVLGLSLRARPELLDGNERLVSSSLIGATVLLPLGFFAGGFGIFGGDPGLGILLLPIGAVLLLAALFSIARSHRSTGATDERRPPPARRNKR